MKRNTIVCFFLMFLLLFTETGLTEGTGEHTMKYRTEEIQMYLVKTVMVTVATDMETEAMVTVTVMVETALETETVALETEAIPTDTETDILQVMETALEMHLEMVLTGQTVLTAQMVLED